MERRTSPDRRARRSKVVIARTALGAEPVKRGLAPAKKRPKRDATSPISSAGGQREFGVEVKTAKKRSLSSTLWLHRQLNDPYVARARARGFRSRSAFKLIELDEKFSVIGKGARVVDLGSAPGGWCQVLAGKDAARIVGIDYLGMAPIGGVEFLELDFLDESAPARLKALLGGEADLILSDMAAPTTGHKSTDHLRIIALADAALDFAIDTLANGGSFVCKVFQGGAEGALLARLKANFGSVRHAKPKASRADSSEMYVVATGFRRAPE